jgi:hypothetical protein
MTTRLGLWLMSQIAVAEAEAARIGNELLSLFRIMPGCADSALHSFKDVFAALASSCSRSFQDSAEFLSQALTGNGQEAIGGHSWLACRPNVSRLGIMKASGNAYEMREIMDRISTKIGAFNSSVQRIEVLTATLEEYIRDEAAHADQEACNLEFNRKGLFGKMTWTEWEKNPGEWMTGNSDGHPEITRSQEMARLLIAVENLSIATHNAKMKNVTITTNPASGIVATIVIDEKKE